MHQRKEEKTVEDNFDYGAPDFFKMEVTETSLMFAKGNQIVKCVNSMGGTVHVARPIWAKEENTYNFKITSSDLMLIYIGVEYIDKDIMEGSMGYEYEEN